jgi:hypothetical protein
MHPYSTDESRVSVYAGIAVGAVVLSWAIVAVTSPFHWPQWLVSAPSMAATFSLLYRWFDRVLWRWRLFHTLGVVGVADLSGVYVGTLVSTYKGEDGRPIQREVMLSVRQTWTRIAIEMTVSSGSSSSVSVSALGAVTNDGNAACMTYLYHNRVNPAIADADMGDHDGAADLRIYSDGLFKGRYFNSRPRAGTMEGHRRGAQEPAQSSEQK